MCRRNADCSDGARIAVPMGESAASPLRAPVGGKMLRTIHEHAACRVYYHFQIGGATVFALEAPDAALEFEYGRNG